MVNTSFLKHFLILAEEKNISHAAERLFLSRSALNRQLLQTEESLGLPLFKRLGTSLELTYAGRIYLDMAKEVLSAIDRSELLLSEVCNSCGGEISFGISPTFVEEVMGTIYPLFRKRYPRITIKMAQAESAALARKLHDGEVDFALIASVDAAPELRTEVLAEFEVLLCAPATHPKAHLAGRNKAGEYAPCDLSWFADDPFCMQGPSSALYGLLSDFFRHIRFDPKVGISHASRQLIIKMVTTGASCAFLMDFDLKEDDRYVCFALDPRAYFRPTLAYLDTHVASPAERTFMDLVRWYFERGRKGSAP